MTDFDSQQPICGSQVGKFVLFIHINLQFANEHFRASSDHTIINVDS